MAVENGRVYEIFFKKSLKKQDLASYRRESDKGIMHIQQQTNQDTVIPAHLVLRISYEFPSQCEARYEGCTVQPLVDRIQQHVPGKKFSPG